MTTLILILVFTVQDMERELPQCKVCWREIEDMICEKCRIREIAAWFLDHDYSFRLQALFFLKLKQQLPPITNEGYCRLCDNERPTLCEGCFFTLAKTTWSSMTGNELANEQNHDQKREDKLYGNKEKKKAA